MRLTIYAVGDIMLGEHPLCYKFGVKSIIKNKGVDYLFKNVKNIFKDGDIIFGNLEAPISNKSIKKGLERNFFRAEYNVIKGLKNANFNMLSIANNHIMEHGKNAFLSTVKILKKNHIIPVGNTSKIEIIKIKGYTIAFMAYSFIEEYISDPSKPLYNKIDSEIRIFEDIKKIRNFVDLIIISLHWGYEYIYFPSPNQIEIGRKLIDYGADIILGSHPHVIQSYEIYNKRPIVYSLGNFIFDQPYIKNTLKSVIVKININMAIKNIEIKIIPITCNSKEYYPSIPNEKEKREILDIIFSIKSIIENKSLCSYHSEIGNYLNLANKYKKIAKIQMRKWFIKNLYKYPLSVSFSIIKNYFFKMFSFIK
ncbi:MAG: CapA family protein [Promethearchaeota archaeon]